MGSFTALFHLVIHIFKIQQPKVIPKGLITTTKQTSKQSKKDYFPAFHVILFLHIFSTQLPFSRK